jgi:hypothetical protein
MRPVQAWMTATTPEASAPISILHPRSAHPCQKQSGRHRASRNENVAAARRSHPGRRFGPRHCQNKYMDSNIYRFQKVVQRENLKGFRLWIRNSRVEGKTRLGEDCKGKRILNRQRSAPIPIFQRGREEGVREQAKIVVGRAAWPHPGSS